MDLSWPRRDKEELKAEDVAACQKCYSHNVRDKCGNILYQFSH